MAVGDHYFLRCNMSVAQVNCGFGMYYESTAESNSYDACSILATEWATELPILQATLSDQAIFQSVYVTKADGEDAPPGLNILDEGQGSKAGEPQEATTAVLFRLEQETLGAKHNGRFYVPGVRDADTTTNYHTDPGSIVNMWTWGSNIRQIEFGAELSVFKLVIKGTQGLNDPSPGQRIWLDVLEVTTKNILHGIRRRKSRVRGAIDILAPASTATAKHFKALAARTPQHS